MDPNANLAEQEALILKRREVRLTQDSGEMPYQARRLGRIVELRETLREWLQKGGFEPDWTKAPNARKYYGR